MTTLFERLRALFAQDPLIDEIGLVFGVEEAELTVANAFVLEEHKLGVAFSAGPQLFHQARTRFHELNPLLLSHSADGGDDEELMTQLIDCTRAVLLISADFYTAWNTRKELVCRGVLDALDETRFSDLVFTLHPKSIDTWAYRRWLASRLLSSSSSLIDDSDALRVFYERQLSVCTLLAEQKPRNYHAWSFRHWIVSQLPLEALDKELLAMGQWCTTHVTDHSGWNHRQHVVNITLRRWRESLSQTVALANVDNVDYHYQQRVKQLLIEEYAFLSKLMAAYPVHEALWCHRRFVVQLLLRELVDSHSEDADTEVGGDDVSQRASSLEVSVKLLVEANADTVPSGAGALMIGWQRVEASVRDLKSDDDSEPRQVLLLALMSEVEIAWRFASRFSRRFALWTLERVLQALPAPSVELHSLARTLQRAMSSHDPLLQDFWGKKH